MGLFMRQLLLLAAIGWSGQLFADSRDFTCVEAYRAWSETYFAKPYNQPAGSTAREREDARRVWGIYHDIEMRRYGIYATEDVSGMLHILDTKSGKELDVLNAFVHLLESGQACEDGRPAKTWVEILELLRPFAY